MRRLRCVVVVCVAFAVVAAFVASAALWAVSYWRYASVSLDRPLPNPASSPMQPTPSPLVEALWAEMKAGPGTEPIDERVGFWISRGQFLFHWSHSVRLSAVSNPLSSWLPPPGYATRPPRWKAEWTDYAVPASNRPGFRFERDKAGPTVVRSDTRYVGVPLWFPTLLLAAGGHRGDADVRPASTVTPLRRALRALRLRPTRLPRPLPRVRGGGECGFWRVRRRRDKVRATWPEP